MAGNLIPWTDIEIKGSAARKISDATAEHFRYGYATYRGERVHIAPYYDADGALVAQHIRTKGKDFPWTGEPGDALPFGSHAFARTGKMLVVTEGEIDALSVSQVQGNKWPVVSIGCGAAKPEGMEKVRRYIAKHRTYFNGFDKVVLMFDMDEQGRASSRAAAEVIGPKAHIATLPGAHDANDMLQQGRTKDLIDAIWRAEQYRPEGIVTLESLKGEIGTAPTFGPSWPWEELTEITYGIQQPYIYTIGAGTGTGKTDVLSEIATHLVREHGFDLGMFMLEEEPRTSALNLCSKWAGKRLHTPEGWDAEAFADAWDGLNGKAKVFLYDSFGLNEWEPIAEKIRFLREVHGVRYFFVDHLTAFAAGADDERKALESIMENMSSLVTSLGITIFLVSHLATPEGRPHEEGGRVTIRHFKGSRAIGFWSHGMLGLERDTQAEDLVARHTTTIRALKLRGFGSNVGKCAYVRYEPETGRLLSSGPPPEGEEKDAKAYGFTTERREVPNALADEVSTPSDF